MASRIGNSLAFIGYDNPKQLLERTAWMCATFALATAAGKFFDSKLQWKSHLTFGQVTSVTFNLLYYNKRLENIFMENRDPQKKEVLTMVFFLMLCILPCTMGRVITNVCFEKISWIQTGKTTLYFGAFGIASFCAKQLYAREKKRPES